MKLRVTVNGVAYDVDVDILEDRDLGSYTPAPVPVAPAPVSVTPPARPVAPPSAAAPAAAPAAGDKSLVCPIPGTVVEVLVMPGQQVKAGETAVIVDAMKMNTQVAAHMDGVVKEILVQPGDAVKMNQALLTFE